MSNVLRLTQEVNEPTLDMEDLIARGPYRPLPDEGLKDVFIHMWSRLNEACFITSALQLSEPGSSSYIQTLAALRHITDVDKAYSHMQSLLAKYA